MALAAGGLGLFLYKVIVLGYPLAPNREVDTWDLEVRLAFVAQGRPVKASLLIPKDTRRYSVIDEHFISRRYGLNTSRRGGNRAAVWSIRRASGDQILYYRATVQRIAVTQPPAGRPAPRIELPEIGGAERAAVLVLVEEIRSRSADVETMVAELLNRLNAHEPDENVELLLRRHASALHKMRTAIKVLLYAGIPARVVHGIELTELERDAPLIHWIQVYDRGVWRSFNPRTGEVNIPEDWFTWWRQAAPLAQVDGGRHVHTRISVTLNRAAALSGAAERGKRLAPGLVEYSLLSLPIETQAVYHVLLMIPIGALILVLMRNVVGVKTFGTFMPVLIALAFRETRLLWGMVLFSLVVALGLSVRFYFDRLKLLLVPRLASVLIVVVLVMALLSVVSHKLGLEKGLSIALFPMVILTMTIERMSIVWEERGAAEALQQGLGSLAVAAIAYAVMNLALLRHVVFVYPELHLVVLAITLLLGRYSGYRLTELRRFRALARGPRS